MEWSRGRAQGVSGAGGACKGSDQPNNQGAELEEQVKLEEHVCVCFNLR